MARNLKGIVLEIGGDTSGLQKALKGIDNEIKNTASSLKDVERLLKMDPGNTELLKQKQRLLGDEVESTKKKLEALKEANQNAAKALANNPEYQKAYEPLKKQIDETANKMKELKAKDEEMKRQLAEGKISQGQYEDFKNELKSVEEEHKKLLQSKRELDAQFAEGHINQSQYDALQREIVETEQKLKGLEQEAKNANTALSNIGQAGDKLQNFGNKTADVGKKMLPVTGAIVGVGAAAGKMAMDFEDSTANINTLLDDDSHLESYKKAIIDLSNETGISADIMSSGMYQAISSLGDGGKETEAIFGTMAKSAKAGGAEVSDSVSLISAGMKGYNQVNEETANKISDLAFETAKLGVTTFPEMAKSMQPLFPLSSSLSMSYEELFGVMATGTGVTGNTAEVSTQLKSVLSNLMKPTGDMQKLMEKYGYSNAQAMIQTEGFGGMLKLLQAETGGQSDQMAKLFSSTEALTLMTALTGGQFDTFNEKLGSMGTAAGATDEAYKKLQTNGDTVRTSITQLKNTLIELGGTLLEVLAPAIQGIAQAISDFSRWFSGLGDGTKKFIIVITGIVAAIGPALIIIGKMATGVGAVMKAVASMGTVISKIGPLISGLGKTIGFIGTAIKGVVVAVAGVIGWPATIAALVTGALVVLYNKCEWFRNAVNAVWEAIKTAFHAAWDGIVTFFTETIPNAWNSVVGFFSGIPAWWAGIWQQVSDFFTGIWTAISQNPILQVVVTTIQSLWENCKTTLQGIWAGLCEIASGAWELLKTIILGPVLLIYDLVTGNFTQLASDAQNIWAAIQTAAGELWNGIKDVVSSLVTGLVTHVTTLVQGLRDTAVSIWTNLRDAASSIWTGIKDTASNIWTNLKNTVINIASGLKDGAIQIFHNMISGIGDVVSGIADTVRNGFASAIDFITSLPGEAYRWGSDIIDNIVSGIRRSIGRIAEAASSVASSIRSYLHFSVPDIGPLSDADEYGGDFISLLTTQMTKALPGLRKTVDGIAQTMSVNPTIPTIKQQSYEVGNISSAIAAAIQGVQPQAAATGDIIIPVYLGTQRLDEIIVNAGQRAGFRSGGR